MCEIREILFITYLSSTEQEIKTSFLVFGNVRRKTTAEIIVYTVKSLIIGTISFSVLNGANRVSGKKNGVQRRLK